MANKALHRSVNQFRLTKQAEYNENQGGNDNCFYNDCGRHNYSVSLDDKMIRVIIAD